MSSVSLADRHLFPSTLENLPAGFEPGSVAIDGYYSHPNTALRSTLLFDPARHGVSLPLFHAAGSLA
jgi:hypothetical protein